MYQNPIKSLATPLEFLMPPPPPPLFVLGAGAFGTALANVQAREGGIVYLWGRDAAHIRMLQETRENATYLPGIPLEPNVIPTTVLTQLSHVSLALLAVPTQKIRELLTRLSPSLPPSLSLISCSKGIEQITHLFPTQIMREILGTKRATYVLSGPGFAQEIGRGLPTALTLAGETLEKTAQIAQRLNRSSLRVYHSQDIRGVEIGGAAKNVLAVATGIVVGRGLGASAQAALATRGFAEMCRLGAAYGSKPETWMGLSGLGDLILTCGSEQSRNFSYGLALGRGVAPPKALAEGALTAPVLLELSRNMGVDMPVCAHVAAVISGEMTVETAVSSLLSRPPRSE